MIKHSPIKIEGQFEYDSFSDLSGNETDGDTFLFSRTPLTEDVMINCPVATLLLQGGSSCHFGNRTGTISTIDGSLTILAGGIIVDGLSIE